MVVSIHQLHYLPWLRYFDKISRSDIFVALDDVQFNKNGWQNRNKIKNSQGWMYLTIPVFHNFGQKLSEVRINNKVNWSKKHWKSIEQNYAKAPYFKDHRQFFEKIYAHQWEWLNELNYEILFYLVEALGIKTKIVKSSELRITGEATDRLVKICQALGAETYLSGAFGAQAYLDLELFKREKIQVVLQDWHCPRYRQQFMKVGFIPDLSIIDLLFNHGPESLDILMGIKKVEI